MPWNTLIPADILLNHLQQPGWSVVDCRFDMTDTGFGRRAWQAGHIPGAVYAHLDEDLSGPITASTGRHPLPDPAHLVAWLERHGIGNDTQVVVYDAGPGSIAARLWWLLRWLGHDAVAVLDGGLDAWRAAGGPLTDAPSPPRPARFVARPGSMPTVDTATLVAHRHDYCLVDARSSPRYAGRFESLDPVAGHVPGARNRPTEENLDETGRMREPAALRVAWQPLLAEAGARPMVAMCGSGVTACHHVLALAHAEVGDVALYPGSWSEWIRDPARPVASGDEPS